MISLSFSLVAIVIPHPQQLNMISLFSFSSSSISESHCGYLAFSIPRISCHLHPTTIWKVVGIFCIHCPQHRLGRAEMQTRKDRINSELLVQK